MGRGGRGSGTHRRAAAATPRTTPPDAATSDGGANWPTASDARTATRTFLERCFDTILVWENQGLLRLPFCGEAHRAFLSSLASPAPGTTRHARQLPHTRLGADGPVTRDR
jgi:hypothetical protein